LQVGFDGCGKYKKFEICFEVEHKDKLFALKWDSLHKHVGRKKVEKNLKGVKKGEWYMA
jgi:hypothetical protein